MAESSWPSAIALVLRHEGGYVDDPDDPGGETNFGISARAYPELDIEGLSEDDARAIYRSDYWEEAGCDELPAGLDLLVFDCAVNQGLSRAGELLQAAAGYDGSGVIGPKTIRAATQAMPSVMVEFTARRFHHYGRLSSFTKFGLGWSRRLADIQAAACALHAQKRIQELINA